MKFSKLIIANAREFQKKNGITWNKAMSLAMAEETKKMKYSVNWYNQIVRLFIKNDFKKFQDAANFFLSMQACTGSKSRDRKEITLSYHNRPLTIKPTKIEFHGGDTAYIEAWGYRPIIVPLSSITRTAIA